MVYVFSSSIVPTNVPDIMYQFKTFMVARGYTIPSSSDGTTFSAGDNIASSVSLTSSLSWFTIKQPLGATGSYGGSRREWSFQSPQSFTNSPTFWKISYTVSGSHNGANATTTIIPSGSDRRWIFERTDGSFLWQTGQSASLFPSSFANSRVHLCADNAPPYGWYMICITTGSNPVLQSCLIFDPMISGTFHPRDPDPTISMFMGTTHNPLRQTVDTNGGGMIEIISASAQGPRGWVAKGTQFEQYVRIPSAIFYVLNSGTPVYTSASMASDAHTGGDVVLPVLFYRTIGNRGGSYTSAFGTPGGLKGYSSMLQSMTSTGVRFSGETISATTGSSDLIVCGDYVLPWSNANPNPLT